MAKKEKNATTEAAAVQPISDAMAIIIPETPKLTASGKTLFKLVKDRLIGIDGTIVDPKLTPRALRQYCNVELKRLHNDRRNLIFIIQINGVDARLQRPQWLKLLSGWEMKDDVGEYSFPEGMVITVDSDKSEQPLRKTVVKFIMTI